MEIKFPQPNDPKLAEFVGIVLGDGSLNEKYIQITMHSIDEIEYSIYVVKLVKDLFNFEAKVVKRKDANAADIRIYNKQIANFMLNLGLIRAPKWKRAIIPSSFINEKLGKYVLRGYCDTDGCITSYKRTDRRNQKRCPRLEMKFSPSPMQNQFVDLLQLFNFKFCKYPIYKENRGRSLVRINGIPEIKKWMKIIGTSNPKHYIKIKNI
jgi:hypothetical protein